MLLCAAVVAIKPGVFTKLTVKFTARSYPPKALIALFLVGGLAVLGVASLTVPSKTINQASDASKPSTSTREPLTDPSLQAAEAVPATPEPAPTPSSTDLPSKKPTPAKPIPASPQPASSPAPAVSPVAHFEFSDGKGQLFVIEVKDTAMIAEIRGMLAGTSQRKLAEGTIVKSPAAYNPGWNFHINPSSIRLYTNHVSLVCSQSISAKQAAVNSGSATEGSRWCPTTNFTRELP